MERIHPTALINPDAEIDPSARVGPYSIVGPHVVIGPGVQIGAHVIVEERTRIGEACRIFHGAVLGTDPQDLKYAGEETWLEIGDRTTIREYCTLNRGTAAKGRTSVGSDCLLMANVHIAHDCIVGDHVIMANLATLGGHVEVGSWAILGGLTGAHQFARIGVHAFVGGASKISQDVPPYLLADGNPCTPRGINSIGLQRRGFSRATIDELRAAYRMLFKSRERNLGQTLAELESRQGLGPEVEQLIEFIRKSDRGIIT